MRDICIRKEHLKELFAHALGASPNEACGFLGGRDGEVERVYKVRNVDSSPVTYRFDPAEQMRVMREMEREGLELVGIYHSHPVSPAYPSQVDMERAFFPGTRDLNFPGIAYVIVSLAAGEPEVKAYLIGPKGVEEVRVRSV
jgi:proteasome lid subunit RPN8/RPN11